MKLQNVGISNKVIVHFSDSVYIINMYNPYSSSTGKQNTREFVRKNWSILLIHIVLNIVYHKVMMTVEITCGCGEQGKELNYLEAEIPQI